MAEIAFIPFDPGHLLQLELQPGQAEHAARLRDPAYGAMLAVPGLSWTGVAGGRVAGCAGVLPQWPGRAIAWALLGEIPAAEWVRITMMVRKILRAAHAQGHRRIEVHVRDGFSAAMRWALLLGFEREGLMRAYAPDGADCWLFAKVCDG